MPNPKPTQNSELKTSKATERRRLEPTQNSERAEGDRTSKATERAVGSPSTLFWDFDGVLLNSNEIRDLGFEKVLAQFPSDQVDRLMEFHRANGGLSRYVKFRYFFEVVREETVNEDEIQKWANKFSNIMKDLLIDPSLLIEETLSFVKRNYTKYEMFIVSGSDQTELRYLCNEMDIAKYFKGVHGSPKPKKLWLEELLDTHQYLPSNCLMIGDSINDYEAAKHNNIPFMAYNNSKLEEYSDLVLDFGV